MKRFSVLLTTWAVLTLVGGCSIAGVWKTIEVVPPDAAERIPFQMVTFTDDGTYTATGKQGTEITTATGTYKWDGLNLAVTPTGGKARVYPGYVNIFTGQLVLTHRSEEGKITAAMEKTEEAIAALEKAVEENPDIVQAYSNLINAYLQKEDVDKAIAIGEKLIEKAPSFALGHNNLAFAHYCRDEYDKAIEHADKAVALGFQVHPDFVAKLEPYRTR